MAQTVRDTVKLQTDGASGIGALISRMLIHPGGGAGGPGVIGSLLAGGGGIGGAGGLLGGAGISGSATLPLLGTVGPTGLGIGAIGGILALYSGVAGIVPALAAAGAGVAAFGALAVPTFTAVSGAVSGVSAANARFQEAAQNVDIALRTSHADVLLYNAALAKMPPGLASAARLLGNQSVTWQALSKAQQNNVVALSQNKSALSSMLPAQRTALSQLLASKAVWDQLTPQQQKIAVGWQHLSAGFQNMATVVAPAVLRILTSGLTIANSLLPSILQLAVPAGNAIAGLAGRLAGFFQTTTTTTTLMRSGTGMHEIITKTLTPFGQFAQQMSKLAGPVITTLGDGFGKIAVALGKLLAAMANPNGVRILRVALEGLAGLITAFATVFSYVTPRVIHNIRELASGFDRTRHDIAAVLDWFRSAFESFRHRTAVVFDGIRHDIAHYWDMTWNDTIGALTRFTARASLLIGGWITGVVSWFKGLPGKITHALGDLGSLLINAGSAVIGGLWQGMKNAWGSVTGWLSGLGGWIAHLKGPLVADAVLLRPHGLAIMAGLRAGMAAGLPGVAAQAGATTAVLTGMGYGTYGTYAAAPAYRGTGQARDGIPAAKLDAMIGLLDEIAGRLAAIDGNTAAAPGVTGAALGAALGMGARSAAYSSLYP